MVDSRPIASVVIPAHDEAAVISRCLCPLAEAASSGQLEVLVVCNGCTDRTAELARSFEGVRVLEIPEASKPLALNAADEVAKIFPRFYVDADVELSVVSIQSLVKTLTEENKECAAPSARFQTSASPYLVRAFYRIWTAQPWLLDQAVGNGVYALTGEGRARFGSFPSIVADDLFVRNIFAVDERVSSADATFIAYAPLTISGLFNMRVRVHRGNAELQKSQPLVDPQNGDRVGNLRRSVRDAGSALDVAIYLTINLAAKVVARWRSARGTTSWERDDSARRAEIER
jgi:hypothetical protein